MADKNVLIPLPLLARIADLLRCWNISGYGLETRDEYYDIMRELEVKVQKLELRKAYTKIVQAKDEDSRDWARIEYLQQRALMRRMGRADDP